MVYIYFNVNFSLSCLTELFVRSCLLSEETESSQEVSHQVAVGASHNFFIMILLSIFLVIFFHACAFLSQWTQAAQLLKEKVPG